MGPAIVIVVVVLILAALHWLRGDGPIPIDPKDPLWRLSTSRAQATFAVMKELFSDKSLQVLVKYPMTPASGQREHVWGLLIDLSDSEMKVTLETPPVTGDQTPPKDLKVPVNELEDWQVQLPDGKIRGGFTTQAQMSIAKRAKLRLPWYIRQMEGRFVDVLEVP
jgi:hypothetical protein